MDKKRYMPPRFIEYVPDQVPERVIQLFQPSKPVSALPARMQSQQSNVVAKEVLYRSQH